MCKHVLNAQVAIRAPCCKRWYDCPECHAEANDHELKKSFEMVFACKKCKKVFRKDTREYEESDEYCPHCDNHYVVEAKTPQMAINIESAEGDHRMIRDERDPTKARRADNSIFGGGGVGTAFGDM
eukprot:m.17912 g.17912  ORF g.17912 m.17912 type:complete len:126 (+) comp10715_c0_seq1:140-517(+)